MQPPTTVNVKHWRWAFIATFAIVTVLTHLPRTDLLDKQHAPPDKLIHFTAFGAIALLLVRCKWMPTVVAVLLLAIWIPFDEWTQNLVSPSREFEWADIVGGWLGVSTIGALCLALRPPKTSQQRRIWQQLNDSFDASTGTLGGLLPCLTGATVFLAVLLTTYLLFWMVLDQSHGTVSMMLAIAASVALTWSMVRNTWTKQAGTPAPQVAGFWWLIALLPMAIGWLCGDWLAGHGLVGQAAPLTFLACIAFIGFPLRSDLMRTCNVEHLPSDQFHG
jgi:hypothetical protein